MVSERRTDNKARVPRIVHKGVVGMEVGVGIGMGMGMGMSMGMVRARGVRRIKVSQGVRRGSEA